MNIPLAQVGFCWVDIPILTRQPMRTNIAATEFDVAAMSG
jgi:hypothetical protein